MHNHFRMHFTVRGYAVAARILPRFLVGVAVNALSAHGSSPKLGDTPEADSVDDAIEGDDDVASVESSEEFGTS